MEFGKLSGILTWGPAATPEIDQPELFFWFTTNVACCLKVLNLKIK
jgi:hypothetical protein